MFPFVAMRYEARRTEQNDIPASPQRRNLKHYCVLSIPCVYDFLHISLLWHTLQTMSHALCHPELYDGILAFRVWVVVGLELKRGGMIERKGISGPSVRPSVA